MKTAMDSSDSTKTAQVILKKFRQAKTIPAVATRLIKMMEKDTAAFSDFEEVIKMDATLVLRILKLVNSSYYALRTKIKSVAEAMSFLGIENLRNLIIIDALKHVFTEESNIEKFSRKRLWFHCAAVSVCCQMIAERIFEQKGEDVFLCGILHDFGLIVENQVIEENFKELCLGFDPEKHQIVDYENAVIGTNHTIIGYLLTEDWGLPIEVRQGIKWHHKQFDTIDPASLTGILQIAEYLIFRLEYHAFPEMKTNLSRPLINHMKSHIRDYRAIVDDLPAELHKAEEIYGLEK
ncbi:MAG: HDOD domain-containing protein [Proteobacteria bacterium]|nr:HDOD domain-containing protein [Pseudomonadota bacterium]MBU1387182.1 HDOD domain-containing protein [Pseudomonadota bacterium]MBU1541500.1 HDOD domain-containing protein [Pseudomonadota bacterium]MBU2482131.1 HDOD domain-containing protein [Pseudomonadota bacterium]